MNNLELQLNPYNFFSFYTICTYFELGFDTVIDYTSESFEKIVQRVDLVVDIVGDDTLERFWSVVKKGGRLL